jgi:trigger factor
MEVTETSTDGLKREYRIVVPAGEFEEKVTSRLDEIGRTINLPGFRPGKVPMQILRRRFGSSVRGEVLESTVQGSSADAIREHNLRPALPPKVDIVSFGEGADLEYKMAVEVLPEIPDPDFADLGLERVVVEVPAEEIDRALERIAEQQRKVEPVARPAASGDIILADVEGRVGDQPIPGATGKDRQIALGSGNFIPGFEDQLLGAAAGEHRTLHVTFPADYAASELAGKDAVFEIDVKEVRERAPLVIDDELGKAVGLENLAELRQEVQQQLQRDYDTAARLRLKRALLDKLAERYDFPVPPGMVDLEFDSIWAQHQAEQERRREAEAEAGEAQDGEAQDGEAQDGEAQHGEAQDGEAPATEAPATQAETAPSSETEATTETEAAAAAGDGASAPDEESVKADYRKIAERRVRLGLLLAEVGQRNNISVTQDELNQAVGREARLHPGYERQVLDFYRQNPAAIANLRAPIFEDKVVDFIVELAKPEERRVTPQELFALPDPDAENPAASAAAPSSP